MNDAQIAYHCTDVDVASSDVGRFDKNRVCVEELERDFRATVLVPDNYEETFYNIDNIANYENSENSDDLGKGAIIAE